MAVAGFNIVYGEIAIRNIRYLLEIFTATAHFKQKRFSKSVFWRKSTFEKVTASTYKIGYSAMASKGTEAANKSAFIPPSLQYTTIGVV